MIKIISCFWNVEKYIDRCITSIKNQTNTNFKVFLIDDMSNDNTNKIIKNLIFGDERFVLITNQEKKFKLKNMDEIIRNENFFNDDDIIVELDGDDYFYDNNVLEKIKKRYEKNKELWLTNGSFIYSNGKPGFSSKVNYMTVRRDNFTFSHLRTWKCHLWRKINSKSFKDEKNEYFKSAPDVAYSFPMIEMAGETHYEFIQEILLVYNAESPYNEHKNESPGGGLKEQFKNANYIRNMEKYNKL